MTTKIRLVSTASTPGALQPSTEHIRSIEDIMPYRRKQAVYAGLAMLMLAGCASMPADLQSKAVDPHLTPALALRQMPVSEGGWVRWGGTIIRTEHLADRTRIEVLAYPLAGSGQPRLGQPPIGRFFADYPGYLETFGYHRGKPVSIVGQFEGTVVSTIGAAPYTFPLIAVQRLHLWKRRRHGFTHFGVGIGLGFGIRG